MCDPLHVLRPSPADVHDLMLSDPCLIRTKKDVVGLVLMNVVIACLLDNLIRFVATENAERAKIKVEEERTLTSCPGPLDPLLSQMATLVSFEDLENHISSLWVHIDADRNGWLTCMEMNEGFRLVDVHGGADIYFSTENFLPVTDGLLSPDGSISRQNFRKVMIRELHLYMQRQLGHDSPGSDDTSMAIFAILCGIKFLLSRKKFKGRLGITFVCQCWPPRWIRICF